MDIFWLFARNIFNYDYSIINKNERNQNTKNFWSGNYSSFKQNNQSQNQRENFNSNGNRGRGARGGRSFPRGGSQHNYNLRPRAEEKKSVNTIETEPENQVDEEEKSDREQGNE